MKILREVELRIPKVPNFVEIAGKMESIADLNDDELSKIGKQWTSNLIARAAEIRKQPTSYRTEMPSESDPE